MAMEFILFIVEGSSDEEALVVPIENVISEKKYKTKTKVLYGDILTKYLDGTNKFEVNTSNINGEFKKLCSKFIISEKAYGLKAKYITKIIYVTDTDYCFTRQENHHKNKKDCLNILFNKKYVELNGSKIPFKVVFMSKNLEHVLVDQDKDFSDEEKKKISKKFSDLCLENFEKYICKFTKEFKIFDNYEKSYKNINEYEIRTSNMNNLLEELKLI
ncbi:hypothetical protein [Oceanivirga salmonicida]|uniref:hypothetical protein n=1 Tax=Oceanivirga salmonicida TaxID=1769291 RepID=UPI0008364F2B|nr:hypothetical protein [Oceanivirga salmonicida]